VNLGEFGLLTGNLEFDTTPTNIPTTVGSMVWNDTDGTLDLKLKGGNVTLQIGQEQVLRVVNKTATNITLLEANYQAVRVTGAQGQRLKVDLALATNDLLSAETIGLVTETIANNQEGFITTSGLIRGINTTGSLQSETWIDGDILYLSPTTAGNITNIKPVAPNHLIIIGYVVNSHITQGTIFVKVDNGYELDELHNVYINPATQANNDLLVYNNTSQLWENKTVVSALGYTPANQTISISTTSPLSGGGDLSANRTLSIADAAADGTTKGAATFTASDFDSTSGLISIDYTNGQAASTTNKGFLTATDWNTFNGKQNALSSGVNIKSINSTSLLGSGNLVIGGLTYFTEAQNTTTPNATVPVDSLTAVSTTTNADFAIIPKGTGAILRQIPDNTNTGGGNKRGEYSFDMQHARTTATQVASGPAAVAFGINNIASGTRSFVIGSNCTVSNTGAFAVGDSNACSQSYAVAFGGSNTCSVRSSFASGSSNTVASRDGAAFGANHSVTADYSFAFGSNNTTSAIYSMSIGYQNTASGQNSIALGRNATTGITRGKLALSSGRASVNGDVQLGFQVLYTRTTGNTSTRLYAEAGGAVPSTQVYPPINGAYRFKGTIIGKQTGTLNAAAWDIDGIIVKGATEASVSLLMGNVVLVQNTPAWGTPTLTADTGGAGIAGTLNISVVGAATTNIQWVCTIQTTEVIY
jgi:hypothetical protein